MILSHAQVLQPLWLIVTWLAALYLLGFGILALIKPTWISRFLLGHASTPALNSLEAGTRLLAGVAFMVTAPDMHYGPLFFWCGAILAVTAIPIWVFHKQHQAFAAKTVPQALKALPLMGLVSIALGSLIIWALLG